MRETPSVTQRCTSTRRDGAPCMARAGPLGYCIGHDPGALEGRRKVGHATSRAEGAAKLLPAHLQPMVSVLEDALGEVHRGELDPPGRVGYGQFGRCPGAGHDGRRTGRTIEGA